MFFNRINAQSGFRYKMVSLSNSLLVFCNIVCPLVQIDKVLFSSFFSPARQ